MGTVIIRFAANQLQGMPPSLLRRIQLLPNIGKKQQRAGGQANLTGNVLVSAYLALGADMRVEVAVEQRRNIAAVAIAEQQLLRRNRSRRINLQGNTLLTPLF